MRPRHTAQTSPTSGRVRREAVSRATRTSSSDARTVTSASTGVSCATATDSATMAQMRHGATSARRKADQGRDAHWSSQLQCFYQMLVSFQTHKSLCICTQ